MATIRWCREAVATDASSPLPVLFRRSPEKGTESVKTNAARAARWLTSPSNRGVNCAAPVWGEHATAHARPGHDRLRTPAARSRASFNPRARRRAVESSDR
jgi:hypothetical protein